MKKLVHITGIAGTGKTSVCHELVKKGFTAFDMGEVSGLCVWENKETGETVSYPEHAGQEWVRAHKRVCNLKKLKSLIESHQGDLVITGLAMGNQNDYLPLFDKVFLLQCSPGVISERLSMRTTNIYAKTSSEKDGVLKIQEEFDSLMIRQGAITVDTTDQSIHETVTEIISKL